MKANEVQVGGDHYKAGLQHWDWVEFIGMEYLPANATKYLTRWKKKHGLQDLEKADHYLDKFIENERRRQSDTEALTDNFILQNKIEPYEAAVIRNLVHYGMGTLQNLVLASGLVKKLIEDEKDRLFEQNRL